MPSRVSIYGNRAGAIRPPRPRPRTPAPCCAVLSEGRGRSTCSWFFTFVTTMTCSWWFSFSVWYLLALVPVAAESGNWSSACDAYALVVQTNCVSGVSDGDIGQAERPGRQLLDDTCANTKKLWCETEWNALKNNAGGTFSLQYVSLADMANATCDDACTLKLRDAALYILKNCNVENQESKEAGAQQVARTDAVKIYARYYRTCEIKSTDGTRCYPEMAREQANDPKFWASNSCTKKVGDEDSKKPITGDGGGGGSESYSDGYDGRRRRRRGLLTLASITGAGVSNSSNSSNLVISHECKVLVLEQTINNFTKEEQAAQVPTMLSANEQADLLACEYNLANGTMAARTYSDWAEKSSYITASFASVTDVYCR